MNASKLGKKRGPYNSFSLALNILHLLLAIEVASSAPTNLLVRLSHVSRLLMFLIELESRKIICEGCQKRQVVYAV